MKVPISTHEPLFTIKDFFVLFKQAKFKLLLIFSMVFFLSLALFFCQTPKVTLTAFFRDASDAKSALSIVEEMMPDLGQARAEGEGISIMKSNLLLKPLIQQLGLQAKIRKDPFYTYLWSSIKSNIAQEFFQRPPQENFPLLQDLVYEGVEKKSFFLSFEQNGFFVLLDTKKRFLERGHIDTPFSYEELSFVIDEAFPKEEFFLTVLPWTQAAKKLRKNLQIKPVKGCKNHLHITFKDSSQKRGSALLNLLMDRYINFLETEKKETVAHQLHVLSEKKKEHLALLQSKQEEYAKGLEKHLQKEGILDVSQAIEKFTTFQNSFLSQLAERETQEKSTSSVTLLPQGDTQKGITTTADLEFEKLSTERKQLEEEKTMMENWVVPALKKALSAEEVEKAILENPHFSIDKVKELFLTYQEKHQNFKQQQALYTKLLSQLTREPKARGFLQGMFLGEPLLEASIGKVMELNQKIADQQYITEKEKARWQQEAEKELLFLKNQLRHRLRDTRIQRADLEKKWTCLKEGALKAIERKLSTIHEDMDSLIENKALAKEKEKSFFQNQVSDVEEKKLKLPRLLLEEKKLQKEADIHQGKLDLLTKAVESQVIAKQIEKTKARPIDQASIVPKEKFFYFFIALALAFVVAFSYYAILFIKVASRGALVTLELLQSWGLQAIASKKTFYAIQTLASHSIQQKKQASSQILGCIALPEDILIGLTEVFFRRKEKALVIYCDPLSKKEIGFCNYLNGDISSLPLHHTDTCDLLFSGPAIEKQPDLLLLEDFAQLLKDLRQKYDWILMITHHAASHPVSHHMMNSVQMLYIHPQKETLQDLQPYFNEQTVFLF